MTGSAAMKILAFKISVILLLFVNLAIVAGAEETASIFTETASSEASSSFDAFSFFGNSDDEVSATPESAPEGGADFSHQVSGLVFTGEATTDLSCSITEPLDSSARSGGYNGASSLRLDATGGDRNEAKIEASVIVNMFYGDVAEEARDDLAAALVSDIPTASDRVAASLLGSSGPLTTIDLKKLYLSVYTPRADVSVGRMIVNYGRGTVFSPVDLFSGVDTSDLALGRTGNDALRVLFSFGNFSGLDLVATIADSPEQSIAGGRFFGHSAGWDYGISAFRDGRDASDNDGDLVVGLDLKGDIELGISAEALARLPFDAGTPDTSEVVYSLMAGLDYSLKGEWFFDLEYLWNIRAGQTYPIGGFRHDHNLFASLSWKPDELTALDVRAIAVPSEALGQVTLGASRSVAKGTSLLGFVVYSHGNFNGSPDPALDSDSVPVNSDAAALSLGARLSVAY